MGGKGSGISMDKVPCVLVKEDKVIEVNEEFIEMTEYNMDEIIGKNIEKVFSLLRGGPCIDAKNIDEKADYFLFTKSLEVRYINIEIVIEKEEIRYIIIEKQGSKFEIKHSYLSQLCKSNDIGVAVYSVPDMVLIKANQKYLDFLEPPFNKSYYSIGRKIEKIITNWKESHVAEFWQQAICTGELVQINEYEHIGYERGITYWNSIITPVLEDGAIKYVVSNTSEVTEQVLNRKRIQEQMEAINLQNRQMEAIFESMPKGIFVNYKDANILLQNDVVRKIIHSPSKLRVFNDSHKYIKYFTMDGKSIDFEETPSFRALSGKKIKDERIIVRCSNKDMVLDVSASPIYDEENNVLMSVASANDVTELVNSQIEIKNQKEQLKAIIENMSDGLVLIDKSGKLTMLNKSAEKYFYTMEIMGEDRDNSDITYFDISGNELRKEELPSKRIIKGQIVTEFRILVKKHNSDIYICINGNPVYDDNGNFLFGIMCMKDITEKVIQEKIIRLQQDSVLRAEREKNEALEKTIAMKDEFLSIISHEFRTPLNVINSAVQAMKFICSDDLSDKAKKYLSMIKLNTYRQLRLVNNLLDVTLASAGNIKINKRNLDIVFLTEAIVDSVKTYAAHKDITLTFITLCKEKVIGIDDEKYERILLNILSNAIKFTPANKSITVRLGVKINNVYIEIEDKGIGIPSEKIDTIFERFGQVDSSLSRQAEGTGIGLSIVKKFVEALGGSISVKSEIDRGSTFTIFFPNEEIAEDISCKTIDDLLSDNKLVQITKVEFSDIYL